MLRQCWKCWSFPISTSRWLLLSTSMIYWWIKVSGNSQRITEKYLYVGGDVCWRIISRKLSLALKHTHLLFVHGSSACASSEGIAPVVSSFTLAVSRVAALLSAVCPQPGESDAADAADAAERLSSRLDFGKSGGIRWNTTTERKVLLSFTLCCYTTRIMLRNYFCRFQLKVHIIILLLRAALSSTRHPAWYFRNKVLKQIKWKEKKEWKRSETSLLHTDGGRLDLVLYWSHQ